MIHDHVQSSAKKYIHMKGKSPATQPLIGSSKPGTAQFGQVSPSARRISEKTMTVAEYIGNKGQDVRATDLHVLRAYRDRLKDKLQEANASEYTGLQEAV